MSFSTQVQLPDWSRLNPLFDNDTIRISHNQAAASDYLPQAASLENQTSQQNLDDRSTLRGLANGLATRDPTAQAGAAVLPVGVPAVNALASADASSAATKLQLLQYGNSLPIMPFGGGQTNALAQPSASATPGQGQGQGASPAFLDKMQGSENPNANPATVNRQGYAGNFQFGTGRLTDLNLYQPAQGENPNGNQWHGTFNIPGFPDIQTHADFLHGPVGSNGSRNVQRGVDAQRMAAEVQFKDIGNQIDNTPGAQDYDRNGLMAVAHLGGIHGMQQFVATGGKYNPGDNPRAPGGGTHLSDYYSRFASGGVPALQQSFGHPQGPLASDHPARQQIASNTGTAGIPQTMTDASPAPMPVAGTDAGVPAGTTQSSTPQQVSDLLNSFRSNQAKGNALADDGSGVAVDPSYLASKNAPAPGVTMTSTEAVSQASHELADRLPGMPPQAANDLVAERARQLLNASMLNMPTPPLNPASGGQVAASPGSPAGGTSLMPAAVPANAPRPIIPGSKIMTTGPFADQRFPPAAQDASAGAVGQPQGGPQQNALLQPPQNAAPAGPSPGGPAMAPASQNGSFGQAQAPGAAAFGPASLPPGAKPVMTGPGGMLPYSNGAPKGYAWAKSQPTAQSPQGDSILYRIDPPEAHGRAIPNPDGSQTQLDTQGYPLYTSAPNTRDIQIKDYEADRNSAGSLADAANTAQTDQIRLQHALTLAGTLRTGANGGTRAEWANLAETYLPANLAKEFSTSLIGDGGAAAAQQFDKLMVQSAGSQERGVLGARGGYQATQLFMKANPGLNMQGSANQDILNMQLIGKQADADYAQGAVSHFNTNGDAFRSGQGNYTPLTKYDQQWLGQRNPQIYAAAMGAATGQPFAKWTEGLNTKTPTDVQKVIDIVRRAKPNSTIQWANGQPQMIGSN